MEHVSLAVFDYNRKKLCDIYDSDAEASGQAKNIILTQELNGWKEQSFELPMPDFRWGYIKNDCLVRLKTDSTEDWFLIQTPKLSNTGRALNQAVKCPHLSTVLKTKNLYLVFDDENGIGNIRYLIGRALTNTGWELGECDTFYERDGETEKVRSLSSSGKKGAYQLVTDICNLFNAYPVYRVAGNRKTVDIRALNNKLPICELLIGKNLETLNVEYRSDSIVTRLYVEGEYGDDGYVGIDSENPTGLTFLLDFDYYRQLGLFSQEHEAALDAYLSDESGMPYINNEIKDKMAEINEGEDLLNTLWGQCDYVIYVLSNGTVARMIKGGTVLQGQDEIGEDEKLLVFKSDLTNLEEEEEQGETYREVTGANFEADDTYAIKFITAASGSIGAREVAIESKEKMIATLESDEDKCEDDIEEATEDYNDAVDEYEDVMEDENASDQDRSNAQKAMINLRLKKESLEQKLVSIQSQTEAYQTAIAELMNGTEDYTGLYEAMQTAMALALAIDTLNGQLKNLQSEQEQVEGTFAEKMGDMLKDGYWSDTNYAAGQERLLYYDALDRMEQVSKPQVKYTVSLVMLSEAMGFEEGVPEVNAKVKILDEALGIKDVAYISKRTMYLDDPRKGSVEISNEDLISATAKNFETVMSKVTHIADVVEQRNALYERAQVINANGTLPVEKITGTIEIQQSSIASTQSSWYTDENGAMIFESVLGDSAYKIGGDGFMVATTKEDGENWDWRLFASGSSSDATSALTGEQANSITVQGTQLSLLQSDMAVLQGDVDTLKQKVKTATGDISSLKTRVNNANSAIVSFGTALENNGQISIPTTRVDNTSGPNINFNIADTAFYKAGQISAIDSVSLTGRVETVNNKHYQDGTVTITLRNGSTVTKAVADVEVQTAYERGEAAGKAEGWNLARGKYRLVGNIVYGPGAAYNSEDQYKAKVGGAHDYTPATFVHGGTTESNSWSGYINGMECKFTQATHSSALGVIWE